MARRRVSVWCACLRARRVARMSRARAMALLEPCLAASRPSSGAAEGVCRRGDGGLECLGILRQFAESACENGPVDILLSCN